MAKSKKSAAMWEFLKVSGVLDYGTPEDIAQAKIAYRKKYLLEYRRKRRKHLKEVTVAFPLSDFERIQRQAQEQRCSIPEFIRTRCDQRSDQETHTAVPAETHQVLINLEVQLGMIYSELELLIDYNMQSNRVDSFTLDDIQQKITTIEKLVKTVLPTS